MKIHFLKAFVIGMLFIVSTGHSETHYTLDGRLRSRPQSLNLVGTAAWDGKLWGEPENQKENPFYGFFRIGGRLGGSPTSAAFIQIAPMAPLIFEIQKSMTDRRVNSSYFDCHSVECLGRIDRTDLTVRLAGSFQDCILFGSILWRDIVTLNSLSQVALETESFIVPSGSHRFIESSTLLGYKLARDQTLGLLLVSGEIPNQKLRFETTYGIYQTKWEKINLALGAGPYRSTHEELNGTSVIFAASQSWGESLSLF